MRAVGLMLLLAALAPTASAAVLATKDEVLAEAFPGARIEQLRSFLNEDEAAGIEEQAGTPLPSRVVLGWRAFEGERLLGTAYLDRHLVRTLPESILVLVSPGGEVHRIELLAFDEPRDYLPPRRWLDQFDGRPLGDGLQIKRDIRGISGATLSGRAVTEAVRRVLAVHALLARREAPTESRQ